MGKTSWWWNRKLIEKDKEFLENLSNLYRIERPISRTETWKAKLFSPNPDKHLRLPRLQLCRHLLHKYWSGHDLYGWVCRRHDYVDALYNCWALSESLRMVWISQKNLLWRSFPGNAALFWAEKSLLQAHLSFAVSLAFSAICHWGTRLSGY